MYLITGAGGGVGGVSRTVVELLLGGGESVRAMVHRDDARADGLRELGADVVVGDLTRPVDVAEAMAGADRMFFSMSVSPDYLEATTIVCDLAREKGDFDVIVNMSQMTVSQMTSTSVGESRQHRLHWLGERVLEWAGLPVVHVRPTVFLDNPLFTTIGMRSVRADGVLALPFGTGRTSPVAAADVARVVAAILRDPVAHAGPVYELTGPESLDIDALAAAYAQALGRPVTGLDVPLDDWLHNTLGPVGLPVHVTQHIATMARLHREGRYDRATNDVEKVTGAKPERVQDYIADHPELFPAR
jgi:uncharacterized protein YbjT (DUF2867 family)